jgi:hypothetical protein
MRARDFAALRKAGATQAYVYPCGDADHPVPARLYRSLGFTDGPCTYFMRIGQLSPDGVRANG